MYFLNEENGYIISVQEGGSGSREITAEEYAAVLEAIAKRPEKEGYVYRLKADLTWEEYGLPPVEEDPDPEISDSEALGIILGGEG